MCNTHLQLAGYPAAKRDRRSLKREESQQQDAASPTGKMSSQSNDPTSSSMELSDGDPYTFSDDTEPTTKPEPILCPNLKKTSMDTNNTHHSSPMTVEPLTPSSTSSSSVDGHMEISICKKSYVIPPVHSNGLKIKAIKADLKPKLSMVVKKNKSLKKSHKN